jgi:hypothetical protein
MKIELSVWPTVGLSFSGLLTWVLRLFRGCDGGVRPRPEARAGSARREEDGVLLQAGWDWAAEMVATIWPSV